MDFCELPYPGEQVQHWFGFLETEEKNVKQVTLRCRMSYMSKCYTSAWPWCSVFCWRHSRTSVSRLLLPSQWLHRPETRPVHNQTHTFTSDVCLNYHRITLLNYSALIWLLFVFAGHLYLIKNWIQRQPCHPRCLSLWTKLYSEISWYTWKMFLVIGFD